MASEEAAAEVAAGGQPTEAATWWQLQCTKFARQRAPPLLPPILPLPIFSSSFTTRTILSSSAGAGAAKPALRRPRRPTGCCCPSSLSSLSYSSSPSCCGRQ